VCLVEPQGYKFLGRQINNTFLISCSLNEGGIEQLSSQKRIKYHKKPLHSRTNETWWMFTERNIITRSLCCYDTVSGR
jgi:hypothetical protein